MKVQIRTKTYLQAVLNAVDIILKEIYADDEYCYAPEYLAQARGGDEQEAKNVTMYMYARFSYKESSAKIDTCLRFGISDIDALVHTILANPLLFTITPTEYPWSEELAFPFQTRYGDGEETVAGRYCSSYGVHPTAFLRKALKEYTREIVDKMRTMENLSEDSKAAMCIAYTYHYKNAHVVGEMLGGYNAETIRTFCREQIERLGSIRKDVDTFCQMVRENADDRLSVEASSQAEVHV